jgi:hypothetical protein
VVGITAAASARPGVTFGAVLPHLQAVLRSIAYSTSCDRAEHNLPGYHLLKAADWAAAAAGAPHMSGEKSAAGNYTIFRCQGILSNMCNYYAGCIRQWTTQHLPLLLSPLRSPT